MRKPLLIIALSFLIFSCNNEVKEVSTTMDSTSTGNEMATKGDNNNSASVNSAFDWTSIPVSTVNIGSFPYMTAPEGFEIQSSGKKGKSGDWDFNKMIMYNGNSFFDAEGKKAKFNLRMKNDDANFNQFLMDKSVDSYLKSIGGVLLFKGQIPNDKLEGLNKEDDMTVYNFIVGDPWNSDPVRHYALNHGDEKVFFQVWSNSAEGEVGVVELQDFKQTVKAPTASEMQKEIESGGKAILNINFDTDKATLTEDGQKVVDQIFVLLTNNPGLKLSIEGHTDNTGSAERNKQLSAERANTTMYALAAKGIDIKRLKATGYGAEKPLVPNDNEENKAKNRRVELVKF